MRTATLHRQTRETEITLILDGSGQTALSTGVGFFDHILDALSRFALLDLAVQCTGDLQVDAHHTVEDVGICLGQAMRQALGDRAGIRRAGSAFMPMDEALAFAAIDISGRPYLAFDGKTRQLPLPERIVKAFDGPVELGGGLRTMEDIRLRMEAGVQRCIIGTAAAENPDLVRNACEAWPDRIAVGIDAKDGRAALRGWVIIAELTAAELALQMKEAGVTTVIYTDVSRDGMMQGPNVPATRALIAQTGMEVIGSGGVSSLRDIAALREAGCAGTILGRALYENAFTLEEALDSLC